MKRATTAAHIPTVAECWLALDAIVPDDDAGMDVIDAHQTPLMKSLIETPAANASDIVAKLKVLAHRTALDEAGGPVGQLDHRILLGALRDAEQLASGDKTEGVPLPPAS